MYQKDEWIEKAKKEWRDSSFVQEINKKKEAEENKK